MEVESQKDKENHAQCAMVILTTAKTDITEIGRKNKITDKNKSRNRKGGKMKLSEQLKKEFIEKLDVPEKDKFFAEIGIDYIIMAVKSEQIEECYQNFQKNIKSAFGGAK